MSENNIKVRVRFSKKGSVKYVGHLDMMRYFQKAIRRAELDVAYSEGFSPHQKMSFAAPLGVGMESEAEYFDMEMYSEIDETEAVRRLNEQMALGISVMSFKKLKEGEKKAMAQTYAMDYRVDIREGYSLPEDIDVEKKLTEFLSRSEIQILKKTKKSEVLTDIRPLIFNACIKDSSLFACLCSSSGKSLNIKLFLTAFYDFLGLEFDPLGVQITRLEVYKNAGSPEEPVLISLDDV